MKNIYLKKNEDRRIRNGHLWIFSNEILKGDNDIENGELVNVFNYAGDFIGNGFYNRNSLIATRVLSFQKIESLKKFIEEKIQSAFHLRKQIYPERDSFRLIFSESDFLPGLIIDKYNSTFVLQINSCGIEKNIDSIVAVLRDLFNAKNILSKNETHFRILEGLPDEDKIYLGENSKEIIDDGKIKYEIDFQLAHKTGFYFDQSDNRFFIEKIVKNQSVLDAFCNSGGFGLHALSAGAKEVTFLDSSEIEINKVKRNCELNYFTNNYKAIVDDVFDYLENCIQKNIKYNIVMIDPPAFAKSKKNISAAIKGYEKLNRKALLCTTNNGYLVSSSCSYHLNKEIFFELINKAAIKENINLQLIHYNEASLDHPKLLSMPETSYLKFAIFRVLRKN